MPIRCRVFEEFSREEIESAFDSWMEDIEDDFTMNEFKLIETRFACSDYDESLTRYVIMATYSY